MTETGKDEYTSDEVVVYGEQLYSERPSQESVELDTLSSGTGSMADADLIITKEDGANAWVKKTASKLWDYIKEKIQGSSGEVAYGTCDTAAGTAAKVVTLDTASNWKLKKGTIVAVKFTNTNTFNAASGSPVTLEVNGTGAKNIYWGGSNNPTGTNTTAFGRANYINTYVYDGTYWVWCGSSQDNNTTYNLSDRSMDVYCETAAGTAAKVGAAFYYTLTNNTKFHIRFRYANSAQSKLTLNVDSKGAKDLYINGVITSASNYTLPAGEYECIYYNNAYYLRTDSPYAGTANQISYENSNVGDTLTDLNDALSTKFTSYTKIGEELVVSGSPINKTLSESLDNFKAIAIFGAVADTGNRAPFVPFMPINLFKTFNNSATGGAITSSWCSSGTNVFDAFIYYINNTKIHLQVGGNASSNLKIRYFIYGIN